MSQEDLRNEMVSAFRQRQQLGQPPKKPIPQKPRRAAQTQTFGITNLYPEYEKSPYVPQHAGQRSRIWILGADGKLSPVMVRTGITDGKFTEITTTDLKPGDQIVMGASQLGAATTDARNPLTPGGGGGGPRPGGGGGGGFR